MFLTRHVPLRTFSYSFASVCLHFSVELSLTPDHIKPYVAFEMCTLEDGHLVAVRDS